jgi:hypothetical protein
MATAAAGATNVRHCPAGLADQAPDTKRWERVERHRFNLARAGRRRFAGGKISSLGICVPPTIRWRMAISEDSEPKGASARRATRNGCIF